jgi:hypothetical protein
MPTTELVCPFIVFNCASLFQISLLSRHLSFEASLASFILQISTSQA